MFTNSNRNYVFGSLTRISDLADRQFTVSPQPKTEWDNGDYVVAEVVKTGRNFGHVELSTGRIVEVIEGDYIVGAFGTRAATLEIVGDWRKIDDDLRFDLMTPAGLFGKVTSLSVFMQHPVSLRYVGHVFRNGRKCRMKEFIDRYEPKPLAVPVVLIVGTSMSAGKTLSARIIVRRLKQAGFKVIGAKLTGAARYRDALSIGDAGADWIFDFVDMGLPSTVCAEQEFCEALGNLLNRVASLPADVIVVEAGASPLEPYNGAAAVAKIEARVRLMVLCASDPYAVVGVCQAFKRKPDIVAGGAANTDAGAELVEKLTGLKTLNLMNKHTWPELDEILKSRLQFG